VPNRYAIKAKEVSPEILSISTKPYYIPFYNSILPPLRRIGNTPNSDLRRLYLYINLLNRRLR